MRTIADGLTALPGAKAAIMRTADEYDRKAHRAENGNRSRSLASLVLTLVPAA